MDTCPCGVGSTYLDCCGKFHQALEAAKTPLELMRSRYSAFVKGLMDYIERTMRGPALQRYKSEGSSSQNVKWCGLEIRSTYQEPEAPTIGFVEFVAHYQFDNAPGHIHELSEFRLEQEQWYYVNGKLVE